MLPRVFLSTRDQFVILNSFARTTTPIIANACRESVFRHTWERTVPYLRRGVMKDFVLHTQGVVDGMRMILRSEKADPTLMIPSAMLHDVGWANVPGPMQLSMDPEVKKAALERHILEAPPIIRMILAEMCFTPDQVDSIIDIVSAHKTIDPTGKEQRLLIDADNLSDIFGPQFHADARAYRVSYAELLAFRMKNTFYTDIARSVFVSEVKKRNAEIASKNWVFIDLRG